MWAGLKVAWMCAELMVALWMWAGLIVAWRMWVWLTVAWWIWAGLSGGLVGGWVYNERILK